MEKKEDEDSKSFANESEEVDYMEKARALAEKSEDPKTQVGACLVNSTNEVIGTGYNRMPNGCEHFSWKRRSESADDNKHLYVCHAEMNAIVNVNPGTADLRDCTLYTTLFPCHQCAKLIIQSGIKEVVYDSDKLEHKNTTKVSKRMLQSVGVKYRPYQVIPTKKKQIASSLLQNN